MRPVKNVSYRYFDVGDWWHGLLIIGLTPCPDRELCQNKYRNFDVACGGDRRELQDSRSQCIFFVVEDRCLASEQDGGPIG